MVWMVAAACFMACVAIWHYRQGITLIETCGIFLACVTSFLISHSYLIEKNTTDHYIASGRVTSLVYRPSYTYRSGKSEHTEPEHWIIEQSNLPAPHATKRVVRPYHGHRSGLQEQCFGRCSLAYPQGEINKRHWFIGNHKGKPVFLHDVPYRVWTYTHLGDPAAGLLTFRNPLRANADVIYSGKHEPIPYYGKVSNYETTRFNRLRTEDTNPFTRALADQIERLNSRLNETTSISVGLTVTTDPLYFEKLRRAWYGGKPNDFAVVVQKTPFDNTITQVNVLTWQNFGLVQHVIRALRMAPSSDPQELLPRLEQAFATGPRFVPLDITKLSYLAIQLPDADIAFIVSYQVLLCLYLLLVLSLDPSTKNQRANWADIMATWDKHGKPSSWRYYLHPLSATGVCFFYSVIPILIFGIWEAFFEPFRTLPGLY
jgi:hypothetical protein